MAHVEFVGVRYQVNDKEGRGCAADCGHTIAVGERYARVMREENKVEVFHRKCFKEEFGA